MTYTAMEWYRRANDAALGGGADITPEPAIDWMSESDADWLDWMDHRHMSDWTEAELQRYRELTHQLNTDPFSNGSSERENGV